MNWESILHKQSSGLAILLDPDSHKTEAEWLAVLEAVSRQKPVAVLLGGSQVDNNQSELILELGKTIVDCPFVGFPGDFSHLHPKLDGLFFLSLLSGRNPDYLIGQQVQAIPFLEKTKLSTLPVGYILVDGGTETSTMKVSKTLPIPQNKEELILHTALAGEHLGMKAIYLEAGSGAKQPVSESIVQTVSSRLHIPLIVGGGIRSEGKVKAMQAAGANLVVVGNHFEENLRL